MVNLQSLFAAFIFLSLAFNINSAESSDGQEREIEETINRPSLEVDPGEKGIDRFIFGDDTLQVYERPESPIYGHVLPFDDDDNPPLEVDPGEEGMDRIIFFGDDTLHVDDWPERPIYGHVLPFDDDDNPQTFPKP